MSEGNENMMLIQDVKTTIPTSDSFTISSIMEDDNTMSASSLKTEAPTNATQSSSDKAINHFHFQY